MEFLRSIVDLLVPVQAEAASLAITLVATLVLYLFRTRVKLIYGRANNSINVIKVGALDEAESDRHTEIYVEKYFLQNTGRKTATNVEFILSSFPTDISVFQPRDVEYKAVEKGHCLVKIPQIAPWELVVIDCAYINQRAAWVSSVKCAEALGREVRFWTVRQFNKWVNLLILIVLLLGLAMALQIAVDLLTFAPNPSVN